MKLIKIAKSLEIQMKNHKFKHVHHHFVSTQSILTTDW